MSEQKRRGPKGKIDEWLTDDGLLTIEGWARDGLTDKDIANNIGIAERTFSTWKAENETIRTALKKGKAPADIIVENALYKRAVGYECEESTTEIYQDAEGNERKHIKKTVRHIPGDTTAMIYWLKNRKPEYWRDKPIFDGMPNDDPLNRLLDILNKEAKSCEQPTTQSETE